MGFFTEEQVSQAKDELWAHCGNTTIGEKKRRRDTNGRSGKEANLLDILHALTAFDRGEKMPTVVINVLTLDCIPKSYAELRDNATLVERQSTNNS